MSNTSELNPITDERREELIAQLGASALRYRDEAEAATDTQERLLNGRRAACCEHVAQVFGYAIAGMCDRVVHEQHIGGDPAKPARTTVELRNGETLQIIDFGPPIGLSIERLAPRKSLKGGARRLLGSIGVRSANPKRREPASVSASTRELNVLDLPDVQPEDVQSLADWFTALAVTQA